MRCGRHRSPRPDVRLDRIDALREAPELVAERVAGVIAGGGTVIFPTDTVYGIGCDAMNASAIERIFAIKDRPRSRPLGLYLGSVSEAMEYVSGNPLARMFADAMLPGPLTLIVARPNYVTPVMTAGLPSVGLRVPDHDLCLTLLGRCGPFAATSANRSGRPAYTGAGDAADLPEADLFVDAGPTPLGAESTVLDVTEFEPRIVREGVVTATMIESIFRHKSGPSKDEASS